MATRSKNPPIQTIAITNFSGRLTRVLNGDLNSGMAKFNYSWGYDPFSKPGNLTWLETPNDITGPITDLPLAGKTRLESNVQYAYITGSSGKLYKISTNPSQFVNSSVLTADSVVGIASVKSGATYNYGASMDFYGTPPKIMVGHDNGVNSINFDGTAEAAIGTTANYAANVFRPLKQFSGNLLFGNGPTFGAIGATNTVISSVIGMGIQSSVQNLYSQINPPFGPQITTQDIKVSPDLNYVLIAGSETPAENIMTTLQDRTAAAASNGYIFQWNGSDPGITSGTIIPSFAVTALQTYLQNNFFFTDDSFGLSVNDLSNKILTLINNKPPYSNAVGVNGNFLFWTSAEIYAPGAGVPPNERGASLYYFGSLDQENPPGLYRLMRYTPALTKFTYQSPLNLLVNNNYQSLNNSLSSIASISFGKHYLSTYDVSPTSVFSLKSFYVTPTGFGVPQAQATYQTQTQLFSKKVIIKQIRVYTEPTVAGNSFQVNIDGSDLNRITQIMQYSFAAGTDPTLLQGSLDRIDFNPVMNGTYSFSVEIVNLGTTNMTIKKIEVDYVESGK